MHGLIRYAYGLLGCILFLGACDGSPQAPDSAALARDFIEALNARNTDTMQELSSLPFHIRSQEWESAQDGTGFVLGAPTDTTVNTPMELATHFSHLAESVKVEGTEPIRAGIAGGPSLDAELQGSGDAWSRRDLYVFLRGMGDVEHIVAVAVDPQTSHITGFYYN